MICLTIPLSFISPLCLLLDVGLLIHARAAGGGLCNRHCSRDCLKTCVAGFLMALDIPVRSKGGAKVSLDELFETVSKAMRKFHPDRNSVKRVGLERSMHCEEVCKDLSLLQVRSTDRPPHRKTPLLPFLPSAHKKKNFKFQTDFLSSVPLGY